MRDRAALVASLDAAGVRCEVGPVLALAGFRPVCVDRIGGLHERRKRSASGSLEVAANLIPACNPCNGAVETIGAATLRAATGAALVVREGDEEWDALGVRAPASPVEVVVCRRCGEARVTAVEVSGSACCPRCLQPIA